MTGFDDLSAMPGRLGLEFAPWSHRRTSKIGKGLQR